MRKLNKQNIKTKIYVVVILTIFFLLFSLKSFGSRQIQDIFLRTYNSSKRNNSNTPKKFKDDRLLLQISKNIKSKEFEKAKLNLSWDDSESYFNNWTIKLLQAYNLAQSNNLEDLQKSRILISQSNKDLEIAEKIQLNKVLTKYIYQNKNASENLYTIIETKTCYREWWETISEIKNTITLAEQIIQQQTEQLENLKNLTLDLSGCISNLINVISNNRAQLEALKNDLSNRTKEYKRIMTEKITNPEKCIWTSFEDTLKNTKEAQKSMEAYKQQQQEISNILSNPTYDSLNQLCNWSKNDSQLNENLSNSISQMMKDLQKQSEKEQKKWQENDKKQDKKEGENWEQSDKNDSQGKKDNQDGKEGEKKWEKKEEWEDKQWQNSNWKTEYKDVLNDQERSLLNQTQSNSSNLMKQIQQIKWQGNYNWSQYIKNLFNSFMGNEWDLENLHETSKEKDWNTKTQWQQTEWNTNSQTQRY